MMVSNKLLCCAAFSTLSLAAVMLIVSLCKVTDKPKPGLELIFSDEFDTWQPLNETNQPLKAKDCPIDGLIWRIDTLSGAAHCRYRRSSGNGSFLKLTFNAAQRLPGYYEKIELFSSEHLSGWRGGKFVIRARLPQLTANTVVRLGLVPIQRSINDFYGQYPRGGEIIIIQHYGGPEDVIESGVVFAGDLSGREANRRSGPLRAELDSATGKVKLVTGNITRPEERQMMKTFWQEFHDWELRWDFTGKQMEFGVDGVVHWRVNLDAILQDTFLPNFTQPLYTRRGEPFDLPFRLKISVMSYRNQRANQDDEKSSLEIDFIRVYNQSTN